MLHGLMRPLATVSTWKVCVSARSSDREPASLSQGPGRDQADHQQRQRSRTPTARRTSDRIPWLQGYSQTMAC